MNITQKRMLVQNNLKTLPYKDKTRIEQAVMQLLGQIHSLQPKVEEYVFNNGARQRLFKLDGTIPINYQGKQYNIPIGMWIPLEFPSRPPMVYVTPVSGMRIKDRHRHVDPQGFVYHPYLHSWQATSSLVDLIGLLCSTFGADPPVFSGPARPPAAPYGGRGAGRGGGPVYGGYPGAGRGGPSIEEQNAQFKAKVDGKLRKELQKIYDVENSEMNKYNEQQARLQDNQSKIEEMQRALRQENEQLSRQAETLVTKMSELEQWLNENEATDDINPETCIVPTDTWAEQCLAACAADAAVSDVMRELDKALEDERLRLPVYLREMRKLARTQFEHRALSQEILKRQQRNIGPAAFGGPGGAPPQAAGRGRGAPQQAGPYFSQYPQQGRR